MKVALRSPFSKTPLFNLKGMIFKVEGQSSDILTDSDNTILKFLTNVVQSERKKMMGTSLMIIEQRKTVKI